VVENGRRLHRRGKLVFESPVWTQFEIDRKNLTIEERKRKSLYAMSMLEVEEMRCLALNSIGIVFASYKMEYWYWELIEMFRK
jgi:hypothetical protein